MTRHSKLLIVTALALAFAPLPGAEAQPKARHPQHRVVARGGDVIVPTGRSYLDPGTSATGGSEDHYFSDTSGYSFSNGGAPFTVTSPDSSCCRLARTRRVAPSRCFSSSHRGARALSRDGAPHVGRPVNQRDRGRLTSRTGGGAGLTAKQIAARIHPAARNSPRIRALSSGS